MELWHLFMDNPFINGGGCDCLSLHLLYRRNKIIRNNDGA